jgi:DmsE family decaheme c-type cytochrome
MKKNSLCLSLLALLLIFAGTQCARHAVAPTAVNLPVIEGATRVGDEACADCHVETCKELLEDFQKSIHGRVAPFETAGLSPGCETCHGNGSLHAESENRDDILCCDELTPAQQSRICLDCHTRFHWAGSEHYLNNVSCIDCHKIHLPAGKKLLAKPEPEGCYVCHTEIQAKVQYPSHHPIREKKMGCSDCHDAHGSAVRGLKTDERLNDLCLKCHASKQGPFVFEHAPVVEDCSICHTAHGTVANNLLKQNEPFICLQCHEFHFHAAKEGYDQSIDGDPPTNFYVADPTENQIAAYGYALTHSTRSSWKRAWTTKCTQCHSKVHGSDLPSQGVPGRGKALTR